MKLGLFAFGRLKTAGLRETADYYAKILQPWCPVTEIELKPLAVPDKSDATRERIQTRETKLLLERLEKFLSPRGRIYLLDEGGKSRSTGGWADLVREWENDSVPEVALCIGSSLGFGDAVKKRAHGLLALGPQTLPHELARVVLIEQIYRAFSVVKGHPYHNA